ncbi:MAG: thioesterase [Cytophagales bacterium]|nr:thioesterase [Cytophagales bacterium]
MEKIGKYTVPVRNIELDFNAEISFGSIVGILMESAGKHADERKFGIKELMTRGYSWVLTRFSVQFVSFPTFQKKLHIETWVEDIGDFFSTRMFFLKDEKGELIATACSTWAVIDMRLRKAVPIPKGIGEEYVLGDRGNQIPVPGKLEELNGRAQKSFGVEVRYTDLDINRHANTVRYVQWIMNAFDLKKHRANRIREFEINFNSELNFGENIELWVEEEGSQSRIEIKRISTNTSACRASIQWAER